MVTGKAEGHGDIGAWGAGTGNLWTGPVEECGIDRMAGYIKEKEMGIEGIVQI